MNEAKGGADFDLAPLEHWLREHVPGFAGPVSVERLSGGQSNPSYRLTTPAADYVLRRKPFGPLLPTAHAIEREFCLLRALHPLGFAVPRPHALCEGADVIGAPFYLMDFTPGRNWADGSLPGLAPEERRALYLAMVDNLARLHAIDPVAAGLGDYGKAGNYFERQVARWTRQYRASETDRIEAMERLIHWLPRTLPPQQGLAIVHGDYRLDNLIFDPASPRVAATIDWELSTTGDPLADYSYFIMNWMLPADGRARLGGLDLDALGIPSAAEVEQRYSEARGLSSLPDLNWYFAFNLFRHAGILQGIRKRLMDGNASSDIAAARAALTPSVAATAWRFAERAGAA